MIRIYAVMEFIKLRKYGRVTLKVERDDVSEIDITLKASNKPT